MRDAICGKRNNSITFETAERLEYEIRPAIQSREGFSQNRIKFASCKRWLRVLNADFPAKSTIAAHRPNQQRVGTKQNRTTHTLAAYGDKQHVYQSEQDPRKHDYSNKNWARKRVAVCLKFKKTTPTTRRANPSALLTADAERSRVHLRGAARVTENQPAHPAVMPTREHREAYTAPIAILHHLVLRSDVSNFGG